MIPVTKPFLPPIEEYQKLIEGIWNRNWLTNNGPLVQELEEKLSEFLKTEHVLFLGNGTIALQIAIKALELKGEIITTPFSYIATTSSIVWEGCKPVFADIDQESLNIDTNEIESKITSRTTGILVTHCFGNPCDVIGIKRIADNYGLKVIYDGAHCFGTKYQGRSIFRFGDITTASFHATKIFHTIEGGAVFSEDRNLTERMAYMRNFGHDGPSKFNGLGINGKNSEFHAAMGIINLNYMEGILTKRMEQCKYYDHLLMGIDRIRKQVISPDTEYNYSYYPVIFETEKMMLSCKQRLEHLRIFPRRYFHPSLSKLDYVGFSCNSIAESISSRILCLPLYNELTIKQQEQIANIVKRSLRY